MEVKQIQHPFHKQHPLVFVESNNQPAAYCRGCGDSLLSSPCFSCLQCNYHLHKDCAQEPDGIPNHPLHPNHPESGFFLRERPLSSDRVYGCALCKEKRNMFFYECRGCYFSLDIKCAKLSSSYKLIQHSKPHIHHHPLALFETPIVDELRRLYCSCCLEPLVNDHHAYICLECPLVIHNKCLERSNKIKHPSHPIHPLFLESKENNLFCKLCQKEHSGCFIRCSICNFNVSIECAPSSSIVEDGRLHRHPFTLLWRRDSFICDACGIEGHYASYICSTCNLMVHKDCTLLPRIIKHSRHGHCIFHKYFLEVQELTRQKCKICFDEVSIERGNYSCVKPGCNYIVHVKCALRDEYLYSVMEDENQCEELLGKSLQSSITRVIEVNEDGEATKIEHFSHPQHCSVLADDKTSNGKCDGCMLSLSSSLFYYCSECPFLLHKTCAELPINKPHWFRPYDVTLKSKDLERCDFCFRFCSGFFYIGGWDICLRCAKVPDIIEESQGHQHLLFFDYNSGGEKCNACEKRMYPGGFKCEKKCSLRLGFECLTLPESSQHKFDEHMVSLSYDDEDKEQCYCDICEKERDPRLWYYHCSICDNSAHTQCVLGDFPFLKDGTTLPTYVYEQVHRHEHEVKYYGKAKGYPECYVCGRTCVEEILKCSTCNYIIHCKCRYN